MVIMTYLPAFALKIPRYEVVLTLSHTSQAQEGRKGRESSEHYLLSLFFTQKGS